MTNYSESQWNNDPAAAQRGPSFEDPSLPSPAPRTSPYGDGVPGPQSDPWGGQPHPDGGHSHTVASPYAQQHARQNLYGQPYPEQNPYATQGFGYEPYGVHTGYGPYAYGPPAKSKAAAALLAFFLGGFGIHDFYLGKHKLGLIHVGLSVGGFLVMILGAVFTAGVGNEDSALILLIVLGYFAILGNSIWAFVEFIMILIKPEHELGR